MTMISHLWPDELAEDLHLRGILNESGRVDCRICGKWNATGYWSNTHGCGENEVLAVCRYCALKVLPLLIADCILNFPGHFNMDEWQKCEEEILSNFRRGSVFAIRTYLRDRFGDELLMKSSESPIEELLARELRSIPGFGQQIEVKREKRFIQGEHPDHKVKKSYRIDMGFSNIKLAIEVDGHEFHKTKNQRTNDARRERELELMGWRVIRFTGSEVFRSAEHCADHVFEMVEMLQSQKKKNRER